MKFNFLKKVGIITASIIGVIYILFLLISILTLVIIPKQAITTFGQGVNLWATKVLPSLLPFFILTKLLSYTTFVNSAGRILSPITKKIFPVLMWQRGSEA